MSLFRTEALRVYRGESRLAVVRTAGRARPRVLEAVELELPPGEPGAAHRVLGEWRASRALLAGLPLHVVLAQPLVPVVTLPWSEDLVRPAFTQALARGLLEKQLQLSPAEYRLLPGPLHYGQPLLAAFVPERLMQEWQAIAEGAGLRLESVTPLLAAVWNRFARELPRDEGRLVVVAEDRIMTVHHRHRRLERMTLRPLEAEQLRAAGVAAAGQALQAVVPPEWQALLPAHARHLDVARPPPAALSTLGALALCGGA